MFVKVRILTKDFYALKVFLPCCSIFSGLHLCLFLLLNESLQNALSLLFPPLFLFCLPLKALDRKEKKHTHTHTPSPDEKDMAGFWTTFLHREPIVVWSCALGLVGAALPVCVPPVRNMLRSDAEPTRPPSAASVVAALRGGKS